MEVVAEEAEDVSQENETHSDIVSIAPETPRTYQIRPEPNEKYLLTDTCYKIRSSLFNNYILYPYIF